MIIIRFFLRIIWTIFRFLIITIPIINIIATIRATKDMGRFFIRFILVLAASVLTPLAWIFGWKWIIFGARGDGRGF